MIRILSAFFSLLFLLLNITPAPEPRRCEPAVKGSFLQSWYCAGWDDARWDEETACLSDAGVEYLILQSTAKLDSEGNWTVSYPSSLPVFDAAPEYDVIDGALKSCRAAGIKVFIGLADFDDWWNLCGFSPDYMPVCEVMADMQREIWETYAPVYGDTLYGWYFVPEIDNVLPMKVSLPAIVRGLNKVLDTATELDPAMPVMLSPYYSESMAVPSVLLTLPMWQAFFAMARFRDGDIFAPQDAVGAGWTKEASLEKVWQMYRCAVDSAKTDIRLWANCENFTATDGGNVSAPPDRFIRQMETASRYADNIICFSMDHFCTPFTDAAAYAGYLDYISTLE